VGNASVAHFGRGVAMGVTNIFASEFNREINGLLTRVDSGPGTIYFQITLLSYAEI